LHSQHFFGISLFHAAQHKPAEHTTNGVRAGSGISRAAGRTAQSPNQNQAKGRCSLQQSELEPAARVIARCLIVTAAISRSAQTLRA
jgi:hypothetical protein